MGIKASSYKLDHIKNSASTSSLTPTSPPVPLSPLDIDVENLETLILVWLDASIDNEQNQLFQKRLRQYVTHLITFNDRQLCEQWLKSRSDHEQILLIIPGELGKQIIANIHQLPSIVAIYVFCWTPDNHLIWSQNYSKIRRVTKKRDELIEQITNDQIYFETLEDSKSFAFFADRSHSNSLKYENASFLWYQLFLEILLSPSYFKSPSSPGPLIDMLRRLSSNDHESLCLIKQFEEKYDKQRAVQWLITNTPLARFVTKALRERNVSMLFYLRFFLIDIYKQLTTCQLRSEHVYRKQLIKSSDLEKIQTHLNQYLIFHGFLLTSTEEPQLSTMNNHDQQFQTVILEIDAEDTEENRPFAYLHDMIESNNHSEVLLMCGSIFKIISLTKHPNSTWNLHLASISDRDLNILTEQKEKLRKSEELLVIADLFNQCDQSNQTAVYCQHLLRELPAKHCLIPQIHDLINGNSKLHSVSLNETQFILLDLFKRLSPLASAMLKTLLMLVDNSILIVDNHLGINFDKMSNKSLVIFASSQSHSSMKNKYPQATKLFILEEKQIEVEQREHFSNSEDLIFQLADELCSSYRWEADNDRRSGDDHLAKQKEELARQIPHELKNVHQKFSATNIDQPSSISTATTVVWLTSKRSNPIKTEIEKLEPLLKKVISSFTKFNDEQLCYAHLCIDDFGKSVFLIIDNSYNGKSVGDFQHLLYVNKCYRYDQSALTNEAAKNRFSIRLIHDLITHYNQLGNECRSRNDKDKAKEMFLKAHHLCELLVVL